MSSIGTSLDKKKKVTILSIDGGGIRGLIPAAFLAALETKIQGLSGRPDARLAEYFDLIVGTSTGGLLALLYATPNEDKTKPKYSAQEAVDLFKNHGPKIFESKWLNSIRNYFQVKYSPAYLEKIVDEKLGKTTLADLFCATALMSFNVTTDSSFAFRSWKANQPQYNYYAKHVARATSAAPTFFPPASVSFVDADAKVDPPQVFLDGGVGSNNPALVALGMATTLNFGDDKVHARTMDDVFMLSLGTGKMYKANEYTNQRGLFSWAKPITEVFLRGDSQEVDYTLHDLSMAENCARSFLRINPFLGPPEETRLKAGGIKPDIKDRIKRVFAFNGGKDKCHEDMDNTTKTNLDNLEKLGKYCADNLPSLLELKLPNCQRHNVRYVIEYIARQLISNQAKQKTVTPTVDTIK